jgi:tetratricopeptide (TPR) repeat protein
MTDPDATLRQAFARHQAGALQAACDLYGQVLTSRPADPEALHLLGVARATIGDKAEGIALIRRAIAAQPVFPDAHFNLGRLLLGGPDLDAAASCFEAALATQPNHRPALWNLALVRLAQNRPTDALAALDRLLLREPSDLPTRRQRAALFGAIGRPQDAVADLTAVLDQRPGDVEALTGRAGLHRTLGDLDAASSDLDQALSLAPNHVEALVEAANVAHDRLDYDAALTAYNRALAHRPDDFAALVNQGATQRALSRPARALESWRRALSIQPDHPDAMFNIGLCLLQMGDWPEGWQAHEARLRRPPWRDALPGFAAPQWDGQADLAGKRLLLVGEQGLGDTMQFCRFVPLVAARGATIILGVDPPLRRLMTGLAGASKIVCPGDPDPAYDLFCPLLSLPARLSLTLQDVAMAEPYLRADPADTARWRRRLAELPGRKIGLVWAGDPRTGDLTMSALDHRRSLPLDFLVPVLAVPGATFVSLQKGAAGAQATGWNIEDWTAELHDFADTAALIEALDLVITVDTAVAHAAGALARPVWVLNRFDRCWRWMMDRTDSPWYPTMRLFTQTRPGVWDDVVADVAAALASP